MLDTAAAGQVADPGGPRFDASPGMGAWLDACSGTFAVSTLTTNILLFLSGNGTGGVTAVGRNFGMTRGLSVGGGSLWVASDTRLYHLANWGGQTVGAVSHDALFVPQRAYFVGNSLLHDVAHAVSFGGEAHEVVFVNTNYSVVATIDAKYSFRPLWKPRHISSLTPGDHCHLNCVGVRDGRLAYASMFSLTDTMEGWRQAQPGSGVIVDMASDVVVCSGLTKPHSIRWHDGRLWVLDSGTGEFGYVDEARGRFVTVTHIGNFLRGLFLIDHYAVIGSTALRGEAFDHAVAIPGLASSRRSVPTAALYVIDLRSGAVVHALLMGGMHGVYDITFMENLKRPLVNSPASAGETRNWTSFDTGWLENRARKAEAVS